MTEYPPFPAYVARDEEAQLRAEAARVQQDRESRALLLYGPGGIGKTWLIRNLAAADQEGQRVRWLKPIDVDDPEYWLLSTLEREVAQQLDPQNEYFAEYFDYLSHLPSYTPQRIAHETVVSHLGRIKRVFVDCYDRFVRESETTAVLFFDTVETVRGVFLVYTLTQWMKALPGTLFVLSGRPPADGVQDPFEAELRDPHRHIPVSTLVLGGFSEDAARDYLMCSAIGRELADDEVTKVTLLTRGHPMWMAFAISFIATKGIPEEVQTTPLDTLRRIAPYRKEMLPEGQQLHEAFRRRLVTPYREVDFWPEAVKRLAVVRQSVSKPVWERLMDDQELPPDVSSVDMAWERLLATPWIRPRANGHLVTLHDAVAEELAQRIIPSHDRKQTWRRRLWERAASIYREVNQEPEAELDRSLSELEDAYSHLEARKAALTEEGSTPTPDEEAEESEFIAAVARVEAHKRKVDQSRAVGCYYELLSDFTRGCERFLSLFEEASRQRDVFLQDRLVLEMQRFLPTGAQPDGLDDVIRARIIEFHDWLNSGGRDLHIRVGTSIASYLIDTQKPGEAMSLLGRLPPGDNSQRFRVSVLKGNALMRVPGEMSTAEEHLKGALGIAERMTTPDRYRWVAEAHKEFGFFVRNQGLWSEADTKYRTARDVLMKHGGSGGFSDEDRDEMASIQTNWAYVKGLLGEYLDGINLVESAITVRHRLGQFQGEGFSWSVRGELYRFERHYAWAWESYAEAERIFERMRDWGWLGVVYQQQASCLFLARGDRVDILPDRDQIAEAKRLVTRALDICRDQNLRSYPSALNRAGRIFGAEDVETGLRYLKAGIDEARRLSDGWFLLANLIEYVELCHQAWKDTHQDRYRDQIDASKDDIERTAGMYTFPDLEGRWHFIQGSHEVAKALEMNEPAQFAAARDHFTSSFRLMAQGFVGSSGAYAIPKYFRELHSILGKLPPETRAQWVWDFHEAWMRLDRESTLLLARWQELY